MTTETTRTSALAARHTELGSGLEDWNGMGTAWGYNSDPNDEHDAVRDGVGMFDMSPLKKVHVRGEDAAAILDHLVSRDVHKITAGQCAYVSVLTEAGTMADDAIISNLSDHGGNNEWMIVHGSGDTMALLEASASASITGKDVSMALDDDLHDISVQGPKALDTLNAHCPVDLGTLKYFHHLQTELFGYPCGVSRTGYSGERGYEIFAGASAIVPIWDQLAEAGVMPCSFASLDKVRIEAGLLFYGYDMTTDHTPWEVGLGFTVSRTKGEFRGRNAVMAAQGKEKIRNVGLVIDYGDMVNGEETLLLNDEVVGVVNSPCYSHRLGQSLALAHISPTIAHGQVLQITGGDINTTATVVSLPVYDPEKTRPHAP